METELHFLTECSKYTDIRRVYYDKIQQIHPTFTTLSDQEKLAYLLGEHKTCCVFAAQYVSLCHHRREDTPRRALRERRERERERERGTLERREGGGEGDLLCVCFSICVSLSPQKRRHPVCPELMFPAHVDYIMTYYPFILLKCIFACINLILYLFNFISITYLQ